MPGPNQSSSSQIRNFLTVIFGGAFAGLLIVLSLIFLYGPTTSFSAKNVLLSPEVLEKMWYNTSSVSTGGQQTRFSFKEIELLYFDSKQSIWQSEKIDLGAYAQFYQTVKGDKGSSNNLELKKLFDQSPVATLVIKASTQNSAKAVEENFQRIEFSSDGQAYRAELKDEDKEDHWAYFYHKDIYNQLLNILK